MRRERVLHDHSCHPNHHRGVHVHSGRRDHHEDENSSDRLDSNSPNCYAHHWFRPKIRPHRGCQNPAESCKDGPRWRRRSVSGPAGWHYRRCCRFVSDCHRGHNYHHPTLKTDGGGRRIVPEGPIPPIPERPDQVSVTSTDGLLRWTFAYHVG